MYYSPLLNYAGRILKDVEAANDVVQECFCRLYERRRELRKELQVRPYLYKSVYNACMDAIIRSGLIVSMMKKRIVPGI